MKKVNIPVKKTVLFLDLLSLFITVTVYSPMSLLMYIQVSLQDGCNSLAFTYVRQSLTSLEVGKQKPCIISRNPFQHWKTFPKLPYSKSARVTCVQAAYIRFVYLLTIDIQWNAVIWHEVRLSARAYAQCWTGQTTIYFVIFTQTRTCDKQELSNISNTWTVRTLPHIRVWVRIRIKGKGKG